MIFFNLKGIAMLFGTFIALAVIGPALKPIGIDTRYPNSFYYLAAILLVIDLVYRYLRVRPKLDPRSENWLTTRKGGSLMLLPAWICSILGLILLVVFGEG